MSEPARAGIGTPPRGKGLLGVSLHDSETLRVDDIATDSRSAGFPPGHPTMSTLLSVPVKVEFRRDLLNGPIR